MLHFPGPPLKECSASWNVKTWLCLTSVSWSLLPYLNCSLFNNNTRNKLGKCFLCALEKSRRRLKMSLVWMPPLYLLPEAYGPYMDSHLDAPGQPHFGGPERTAFLLGSLWVTIEIKALLLVYWTHCTRVTCACATVPPCLPLVDRAKQFTPGLTLATQEDRGADSGQDGFLSTHVSLSLILSIYQGACVCHGILF